MVLDAGCALDTRRNVHNIRSNGPDRPHDVLRIQAAREHDARAHAFPVERTRDAIPVECFPGSAELPDDPRIEHHGIGDAEQRRRLRR